MLSFTYCERSFVWRARHCQKQKPNEPNQTICTVWPWKLTGTRLYLRWMRLSFCHSAETNDWFIEDVTITIAFNIELPKRRLGWRLDPGITRVLIFFFSFVVIVVFSILFFSHSFVFHFYWIDLIPIVTLILYRCSRYDAIDNLGFCFVFFSGFNY